ncbi:uncharacterized protein CC84DRAFT_888892 [Paraphaeosphaeria sporulosa]|uniref:Uncharacterized protein n=1 Tax=Paraphaeosphaeria sporulosa TaxID=1460663 RepID=A0A177C991_9PLEO|nr:uncharacterized protein CC84DRAFT_888892 [Paraphaeosphaeria sporulosa]OAG04135.1 hypothetical protein CC84DRAFT_888892 [Paraphaeosphaeria sporulosa]
MWRRLRCLCGGWGEGSEGWAGIGSGQCKALGCLDGRCGCNRGRGVWSGVPDRHEWEAAGVYQFSAAACGSK